MSCSFFESQTVHATDEFMMEGVTMTCLFEFLLMHSYLGIQEVVLILDSSTQMPRGTLKGSIGPISAYA